jgi:oligopeptide/dipeptide ABC transporter ATP-binding protein
MREPLLGAPLHPYTRLLIDSVPDTDLSRARKLLARRAAPAPRPGLAPAAACPFVARCPLAVDRCHTLLPPLRDFGHGRQVACHRADEWRDGLPAGS